MRKQGNKGRALVHVNAILEFGVGLIALQNLYNVTPEI